MTPTQCICEKPYIAVGTKHCANCGGYPTEDTPTVLGAYEKHQCVCRDCGKQVDTRSETALNPVGHGGFCPKHGGWSSQVPMMCPGCQEQGNDLIATDLSQTEATPSRPVQHKKQELERLQ